MKMMTSFAGPDMSVAINALTKLITVDKADFVVAEGGTSDPLSGHLF